MFTMQAEIQHLKHSMNATSCPFEKKATLFLIHIKVTKNTLNINYSFPFKTRRFVHSTHIETYDRKDTGGIQNKVI